MSSSKIIDYLNLPDSERNFSLYIREILLCDIFGKDKKEILYYYGKDLANNFTFKSIDEITILFKKIGLGELVLSKVKKNAYFFEASGEIINQRIAFNSKSEFTLETGFIAKAINLTTSLTAEGQYKINEKNKLVEFLIQTISK
ncbi:MAG: DUF2507 domain-containing protein [Bombilactobacillus mellifer]|nr:DUF2507 domain-containing protein [Bombilactobacillus mellifer]